MARSPGFLTPTDRKYLTGEKRFQDLENPSDKKGDIRKEIAQTYQDLRLMDASPYWTDDDFAKVFREQHKNTMLLTQMEEEGIEIGMGGIDAQAKIYGDSITSFADKLRDLDIDGSWQDSDNAEKAVEEMFVKNVVEVVTDVLHLVGVSDDDVTKEFFEDVWPEKDQALEIVKDELSDD